MLDNNPPPDKSCGCDKCTAPRFDREEEFRLLIQPKMEEFRELLIKHGFPFHMAVCYGSKDVDGDYGVGVNACGGPNHEGWAPECFKQAYAVIRGAGEPGIKIPVGVSVISGGTLMDVLDAIAQKIQDKKPDSP